MIRRYVEFIVGRPRTIIALVLLVTIFLALYIGKLQIILDVEDQIPPGHPLVVFGKKVEKLFGGKFITIIGVYPNKGTVFTTEILGKIKRITDKVEVIPGVKKSSVISLMSASVKDVRGTEDSIEVRPLSDGIPQTQQEVEQFKERVYHNKAISGLLVNENGTAAVVIADFNDFNQAGGSEGFYLNLEKIIEPERDDTVEIVSTGTPALLYWLMVYTWRVAYLFLLTLAMIGFLHYRAFRTLQGMFIPLVTALMGVVWAMGLMGLIKAPMDPWNIMTPILLLAIGAGHSVQILKRYYEEYDRLKTAKPELTPKERNKEAVVEATTKVGAVMLAAGTIAALSFASLFTLGLPSIKNFGLCTAFGILAALTVEMTFIPAVRVLLPAPTDHQTDREKRKEFFDPLLGGLANIIRNKKEGRIIAIALVLIVLAVIGVFQLEAGNSLGAQFFESNGLMRGFRLADTKTSGTRVLQVLVEGETPDVIKEPDVLQRMDKLEQFLSKLPEDVGKVISVVDVLKLMNKVINGDDPKAEVLPETRAAVAQLLLLYSMSGESSDLDRLVDSSYQRAVITIYLRTDDQNAIKRIMVAANGEIDRLFANSAVKVEIGGGVANAIALNETMVHGKIWNLIQIALIITIITALLLRSLVGGLLVLMPLACSALINLGLMGWFGIWLTMGTAAISAMAVGIGADYAIYFIFRMREEFQKTGDLREAAAQSLTTSGKAIAYVATAVAGGYLCLTLSFFKVHVMLGVLVALTMVTCCLGTVAFLPSVLMRVKPRFLNNRVSKRPSND